MEKENLKVKQLENVWKRQNEARQEYRDRDTFELKVGLRYSEIEKICKQEGVTVEEFQEYARNRVKEEE